MVGEIDGFARLRDRFWRIHTTVLLLPRQAAKRYESWHDSPTECEYDF